MLSIFQKSQVDFKTTKSAFTTGLFKISTEPDCFVAYAFYNLLLQNPNKIKPTNDDIDVGKILNLKSTNRLVVFSESGHSQKAKLLIKPLAKETFKILSKFSTTGDSEMM